MNYLAGLNRPPLIINHSVNGSPQVIQGNYLHAGNAAGDNIKWWGQDVMPVLPAGATQIFQRFMNNKEEVSRGYSKDNKGYH